MLDVRGLAELPGRAKFRVTGPGIAITIWIDRSACRGASRGARLR